MFGFKSEASKRINAPLLPICKKGGKMIATLTSGLCVCSAHQIFIKLFYKKHDLLLSKCVQYAHMQSPILKHITAPPIMHIISSTLKSFRILMLEAHNDATNLTLSLPPQIYLPKN